MLPDYAHSGPAALLPCSDVHFHSSGVPILHSFTGNQGLMRIKSACEAIRPLGPKVNKTMGLHVHVRPVWAAVTVPAYTSYGILLGLQPL